MAQIEAYGQAVILRPYRISYLKFSKSYDSIFDGSDKNFYHKIWNEQLNIAITFGGFEINDPTRAQKNRLIKTIILSPQGTIYLESFKSYL